MNFALAKEIYGVPWCVDAVSFQSLSAILNNNRNGVSLELPEIKYNSCYLYNIKSKTQLIYSDGQLDNKEDFQGIAVINIDGAITLSGGQSSVGMEQVSSQMYKLAKDDRIKGFVLSINSGGGASGAVQVMNDTINEIKKTKPVYTSIKKGGMAGSAAYGIASASTKIFSESGMNIVGSVGTMIQFEGVEANSVSKDGTKNIRLYATKSTAKNKAFEEAVNNDNYELIINELLDPVNENFISQTLANRPLLSGSGFDTAKTVFSKDGVGTFIDGIASFNEVVNMVISESKIKSNLKVNNNNSNSKKMTKTEIKNEHPSTFAEILQEGVLQERERVASWMVHATTDPEAVSAGIESGSHISASQTQKFLVKMHSNSMLANLTSDNAKPVITEESTVVVAATANESEVAQESINNMYSEISKKI